MFQGQCLFRGKSPDKTIIYENYDILPPFHIIYRLMIFMHINKLIKFSVLFFINICIICSHYLINRRNIDKTEIFIKNLY